LQSRAEISIANPGFDRLAAIALINQIAGTAI
jgi:hypothetical protein